MIDIILLIIIVMFSTLLYDKHNRKKFFLKERFNSPYQTANNKPCFKAYTVPLYQKEKSTLYTPSYAGFLNNYTRQGTFSPYNLNENMEGYQPIDYDNNIASIYGYKPDGYETTPKTTITTCTANDGLMGMNRWCGCESLGTTGTTETASKRLIGGVNPRTLIAPQIAAPITDIEEWGTDNYTIHSSTNNYRSNDLFLSGYTTLGTCKCKGICRCGCKLPIKENFTNQNFNVVGDHNYLSPFDTSEQRLTRPQILQNYGISRIPDKSVYTSITDGNDLMFIEQVKKCGNKSPYLIDHITGDEPSMIYDPRRVGYSDSKRSYVDKLLGQPKFYYDDINAVRAPNYITRNKIDIYSFGESTGRLLDPRDSCGDNNQLAVEEFHNSTLQHRSDIMQSLMNKRNGEMWQLREFPISTLGQRMSGGTSKI